MDWKKALKVGGPSVVATAVFQRLIISYMDASDIFKSNIYLNVFVLVLIFSFCSYMGWLLMNYRNRRHDEKLMENNEIVDNEVLSDMTVGKNSSHLINNKIKNNKVGGDLDIG
jgi:hypothetical protein